MMNGKELLIRKDKIESIVSGSGEIGATITLENSFEVIDVKETIHEVFLKQVTKNILTPFYNDETLNAKSFGKDRRNQVTQSDRRFRCCSATTESGFCFFGGIPLLTIQTKDTRKIDEEVDQCKT